jgi:hypothetical protein
MKRQHKCHDVLLKCVRSRSWRGIGIASSRARRPVCLRSRRSNERGAISGRENHRPRRLASSCVRRFITSGKASTVRDQRSRRSRSRSRRRGVQASNSVVHRPAPRRRLNRAPSTRAVQRDIAADIQGVGPEPSVVRSGGKAEKRLRARRWHVRPGARRDIVPRGHAGQPHVKPYGRKDRVSVERRRAKRHEPASDTATTPRHRSSRPARWRSSATYRHLLNSR